MSVAQAISDLVIANRILAHEGVLDAYGHVSVRHPERSDRYFLARHLSAELVAEADILEFDLESNPLNANGARLYSERSIHGSIYAARPDVMAICHNHAPPLLPFTVSNMPMRPAFHTAAAIGLVVPNWEIRDEFGDATNLLVTDNARGASLARTLGAGRVCLMRGHGGVVAAQSLRAAVFIAITMMQNAALVAQAQALGEVRYLSEGEVRALSEDFLFQERSLDRVWRYWSARAGLE